MSASNGPPFLRITRIIIRIFAVVAAIIAGSTYFICTILKDNNPYARQLWILSASTGLFGLALDWALKWFDNRDSKKVEEQLSDAKKTIDELVDTIERQRAAWTLTPIQSEALEGGLSPLGGNTFRICRDENVNGESMAVAIAAVLIAKCRWMPEGGGIGIFAIQSLKMTPGIMLSPPPPPAESSQEAKNQWATRFREISDCFERAGIFQKKNYVSEMMSGRMNVTVPPQQAAIITEYGVAIIPKNELSDTQSRFWSERSPPIELRVISGSPVSPQ